MSAQNMPDCISTLSGVLWKWLMKAVDRWIGVARAPVAGSGTAPACSDRVSKPWGSLWFIEKC